MGIRGVFQKLDDPNSVEVIADSIGFTDSLILIIYSMIIIVFLKRVTVILSIMFMIVITSIC